MIILERPLTRMLFYLCNALGVIFWGLVIAAVIGFIVKRSRPWVREHAKKIELGLVVLLVVTIVLFMILALLCAHFYG